VGQFPSAVTFAPLWRQSGSGSFPGCRGGLAVWPRLRKLTQAAAVPENVITIMGETCRDAALYRTGVPG